MKRGRYSGRPVVLPMEMSQPEGDRGVGDTGWHPNIILAK